MERRKSRFWFWYFGVFLVLISLSAGYGLWRESTLEPVTATIDVRQSATYRIHAGPLRFHSSAYHPAFKALLAAPTDEQWWSQGDRTSKVWNGTPPLIDLEIQDSSGAIVLKETGPVAASNGWTVTGGVRRGETTVNIYKLNQFDASPFSSYTVTVRIVRGSPASAAARAEFYVSTIKAYALLPNALLTVLLVSVMVIAAPITFLGRWLLARRQRSVGA